MTLKVGSLFVLCSTLVITATASADQEPPTVAAPATAAAPATLDPNLDRGFILPTAITQPAGTVTYNNYELLLHGFTFGLTDRVQLSATFLSPIVKDMPFYGTAALKGRVVDADRFHLALQGSAGYGHHFSSSDSDNGSNDVFTIGAGVLASLCLRDDCSSLLSASATYQLVMSGSQTDGRAHLVVYGGSIVHRVGNHVKLLGELTSAAVRADRGTDFDNAPGLLVSYGVRFFTGNIAGDVGFIKPISNDGDTGGILLGLPFLSFSYRW